MAPEFISFGWIIFGLALWAFALIGVITTFKKCAAVVITHLRNGHAQPPPAHFEQDGARGRAVTHAGPERVAEYELHSDRWGSP